MYLDRGKLLDALVGAKNGARMDGEKRTEKRKGAGDGLPRRERLKVSIGTSVGVDDCLPDFRKLDNAILHKYAMLPAFRPHLDGAVDGYFFGVVHCVTSLSV